MVDPIAPDSSAYARSQSEQYWKELDKTPINKLRFADALLARYTVWWSPQQDENVDWLRSEVGDIIRGMTAEQKREAAGDPHIAGMVRKLWKDAAYVRLKEAI